MSNINPNGVYGSPKKKMNSMSSTKTGILKPQRVMEPEVEKYLEESELMPLQSPELNLKQAIDQYKSPDWEKQFEASNVIRCGLKFHKNLFSANLIHQLN